MKSAAGCLMMAGAMACSDNYDATQMPTKTDLELAVDGHSTAFSVDYGAEPNNAITVEVKSNTLWKVEIDSEGGWCSADKLTGRGNETFKLSILENINKERNAFVTVYIVDADGEKIASSDGQTTSITMTLKQAVSDVRLSPASFEPFKASGNESQRVTIEANVAWTLSVAYEGEDPTEFIGITPTDDNMTPEANGTWSGNSEAQFIMSVADNRTAAERRAFLNLRSNVGSYSVEIVQAKSDYTFDVSPTGQQTVGAEGGSIDFGIISLSDWYVQSADDLSDWITFSPSEGKASPERVATTATIAPNTTGSERSVRVYFRARQEQYGYATVDITQRAFDTVFYVSRSDDEGIVRENGAELTVELDSRFRWEASAPSWIGLAPASGQASTSITRMTVTVEANKTSANRTGAITITPLPTEFGSGITIDPAALGIGAAHVAVTQFGGSEAAVSVPWLRDGYTHTTATVEFNFYSPFHKIVEAGLEWGLEDDTERQTMTTTPANGTDATVSFDLTGLNPATRYVARGYVKDEDGNVKEGNWSFPFTTAGQYPNSGDNPPPTR